MRLEVDNLRCRPIPRAVLPSALDSVTDALKECGGRHAADKAKGRIADVEEPGSVFTSNRPFALKNDLGLNAESHTLHSHPAAIRQQGIAPELSRLIKGRLTGAAKLTQISIPGSREN